MAGNCRSARHANNAAGRSTQNGVFSLENVGIGQAARRLHEKQFDARHFAGDLFHISAQDGRQVGINHRGIATADELHHRTGLVRCADLREADLPGDAAGRLLMVGIAVAVHEYNRNAAQPFLVLRQQLLFQ